MSDNFLGKLLSGTLLKFVVSGFGLNDKLLYNYVLYGGNQTTAYSHIKFLGIILLNKYENLLG